MQIKIRIRALHLKKENGLENNPNFHQARQSWLFSQGENYFNQMIRILA